jgi:hypothetical protein
VGLRLCLGPIRPKNRGNEWDKLPDGSLTIEKQCELRMKSLKKEFDSSINWYLSPPFIIAGDLSPLALGQVAKQSVLKPQKAMNYSFFKKQPTAVITILLFSGQKSYRKWAFKLFGSKDVSYFGYYTSHNRTLIMDIETGTGTLIHELTHALMDFDFEESPRWISEGIASLHEGCIVEEKEIKGVVNWRLPVLRKAIKNKNLRSLKDLVTIRDFYGEELGKNYAQARYFMMFAQSKGLLKDLYGNYRDNFLINRSGDVEAIEKTFGKTITVVEKQFLRWLKSLPY